MAKNTTSDCEADVDETDVATLSICDKSRADKVQFLINNAYKFYIHTTVRYSKDAFAVSH